MDNRLHIVSFNIPYPPDYGGIIDVYYKLKTLHALGVGVILHCFEYERPQAAGLEGLCEKVYYYKRQTGWLSNLSLLPYNVNSRKDPALLLHLLEDASPILFEGLHSCYFLGHPALKNRMKLYREANIEHDYYRHLARSGTNLFRNCFYRVEALRFEWYQQAVSHADAILAVSAADRDYLHTIFPNTQVEYMPCFHPYGQVESLAGQSDFILYHGKLSVEENERAALFLIREVFSKLSHTCVIAGMNPSPALTAAAAPFPHIRIEANPTGERMEQLIHEAQLHLLVTFQDTGLKLKLLNSLFAGRHIIVNSLMLAGTALQPLCYVADTPQEMIRRCKELMATPFTQEAIQARRQQLFPMHDNRSQGSTLCRIAFRS